MIDLGTLYTRIEADTSGLRRAGGAITRFAVGAGKTIAGIGVAATAAATALTVGAGSIINAVAQQTKELGYLANQADVTVGQLQAFGFATASVGIDAEKFSDIIKDVNDRIGDYAETGGGPLADFMENIGDKVGLTTEKLQKMSGPEALGAMKNAMDEANISAKEQVFYMESLASDASRLIPLLAEDGKKMKEMSDRARELGISLSQIETDQLLAAASATKELGATFTALKQTVAAALAPIYTAIAEFLTQAMVNFNKEVSSSDITRWAKEGAIAVLEFASIAVTGFGEVQKYSNDVGAALWLLVAGALKVGQALQKALELSSRLFGDDERVAFYAKAQADAAVLIDEAFKKSEELFGTEHAAVEWSRKAVEKINELKAGIEKVDANIIDKNISKPIKGLDKPLNEMHKNFEGIWINGGKEAEKNLKNINKDMDDFNKKLKESYRTMKDIAAASKDINPTQYGAGGALKRKLGGAVKAQAGRFFPGFGGGDKIPILGEAGEYMINKFATREAGVDTTAAYNNRDWMTVINNLVKKMSLGGPTSPQFSGPALALADGGSVSNERTSDPVRNYYISGSSEPITIRANEKNADRVLTAFLDKYKNRSGGAR